jgi:serine protease Do
MTALMLRQLRGVLFILVFLFPEGIDSAGFVSENIPEQIHSLTVELSTPNGESGTGVIITGGKEGKSAIVLTASHVVEGAERITVRFSNREMGEAKLLYLNQEMDYALLETDGISLPVQVSYPDRSRPVGSDIFIIGYSGLFRYALSHGIISTYEGNFLHTDAQASFGSSGSGVWDESGRLVGLVAHVYVEEVESEGQRGIPTLVDGDIIIADDDDAIIAYLESRYGKAPSSSRADPAAWKVNN